MRSVQGEGCRGEERQGQRVWGGGTCWRRVEDAEGLQFAEEQAFAEGTSTYYLKKSNHLLGTLYLTPNPPWCCLSCAVC